MHELFSDFSEDAEHLDGQSIKQTGRKELATASEKLLLFIRATD